MIAEYSTPPVRVAESTSYCQTGQMADGTHTRSGSVAMNSLPLGTRIRLHGRQRFAGRRYFVVRDRIGAYSQLDFFTPSCAQARIWGRRTVRFHVVKAAA